MSSLTSRQRAHLRALAHSLKASIQIGKEGVTPAVAASIADALHNRELLKVKLLDTAPLDVREAADAITGTVNGVHVVQTIGRTIVLYRRHPEHPAIALPGA